MLGLFISGSIVSYWVIVDLKGARELMPFTPLHLGIAVPVKAVSNKKFNLMIFAWAQIVMDLQPLIVILTHRGEPTALRIP